MYFLVQNLAGKWLSTFMGLQIVEWQVGCHRLLLFHTLFQTCHPFHQLLYIVLFHLLRDNFCCLRTGLDIRSCLKSEEQWNMSLWFLSMTSLCWYGNSLVTSLLRHKLLITCLVGQYLIYSHLPLRCYVASGLVTVNQMRGVITITYVYSISTKL